MIKYNLAYKNLRKNIDIFDCHNALKNFHFLPVRLLHSLVLNVKNLPILYDVIIVGDIYKYVPVGRAGGPRFKSRAGQIGHSVANGSPPLRHFFERSCVARAQ